MNDIKIYTTRSCGFCHRAKALLSSKKLEFEEIAVDGDARARQELLQATGSRTVPQIWINGHYVGGCTELYALDRKRGIEALLRSSAN